MARVQHGGAAMMQREGCTDARQKGTQAGWHALSMHSNQTVMMNQWLGLSITLSAAPLAICCRAASRWYP